MDIEVDVLAITVCICVVDIEVVAWIITIEILAVCLVTSWLMLHVIPLFRGLTKVLMIKKLCFFFFMPYLTPADVVIDVDAFT